MKKSTRILSIVLVVLMLASTFSSFVFASKDEKTVTTVAELIEALGNKEIGTIKLANDLVLNENVTYTYENEYVIVKKGAEQLAKINARTLEVAEGSLETLTKWEPKALKDMTLDGQGHKIVGLFVDGGAMFSDIAVDAKVVNLDLVNALVLPGNPEERTNTNHYEWSAVLAQRLYGDIEDINVSGAVVLSAAYPIVEKVYTGTTHTGGVVARTFSTSNPQEETHCPLVKDVTFAGEVVVRNHADKQVNAGGIVSQVFGGKLLNCVNYGNVTVLSGTTYGVGGVAGLVEATAGQIKDEDGMRITDKPIGNDYVFNCANVGTVTNSKDSGSRAAGGVIGFCDPCWSANSTMQFVNLYNGGKVINAGKGVIGSCNGVNAAGNLVNGKAEFIYADVAAIPSETGSFNAKLNPVEERIASVPADAAVYFLNCNAGNIEGAYAWKLENGKAVVDFGKTPDAPKTPEEWKYNESGIPLYDPTTEIALLEAKVINDTTIKLKFSEPVKLVNGKGIFYGYRYCTVKNGVPTLVKDPAKSYLQANCSAVFNGTDTVTVSGANLLSLLDKSTFGETGKPYGVYFCIEMPNASGYSDAVTTRLPGYLDAITSLDGKKLLKATNGKYASDGTYDGVYVTVTDGVDPSIQYITPEDSFAPKYEEGKELVMLSAKVLDQNRLEIKFSEPVNYAGSGAWISLRFCTVNASGVPALAFEDTNGDAKGDPLQVGGVTLKTDGTDTAIATCTGLLRALQGKTWDGVVDTSKYVLTFSMEGTSYGENLPGVIDALSSLDGTRHVKATKGRDDSANGIYDGAYVHIDNPYEGQTVWTVPAHEEGDLAFLGAELVAPRKLKLNFTLPVKVTAKAPFAGIRYKLKADVEASTKPGYSKNAAGTEIQYFGSLKTDDAGNCYFETTYDLLPVLEGKGAAGGVKVDEGKEYEVFFCFEGLDNAGDNTPYFVDNIQSLDGTKRLMCSPSFYDTSVISAENPAIRGIYDGAYALITPHTEHNYEAGYSYDATQHWIACSVCGQLKPETEKENHKFDDKGVCETCKCENFATVDAPEFKYVKYYNEKDELVDLTALYEANKDNSKDATGRWQFFNGTHLQNKTAFFSAYKGNSFEITFDGTGIEWHTQYRGPTTSSIAIYVDGKLVQTIDGASISAQHNTSDYVIYGVNDLENGRHTLRGVALSANQMPVDYFKVYGTPVETAAHEFEDGVVYKDAKEHIHYFKGSQTDGFVGNHVIDTTGKCSICNAQIYTIVDAAEYDYLTYYNKDGEEVTSDRLEAVVANGKEQGGECNSTIDADGWKYYGASRYLNSNAFVATKAGNYYEITFTGTGLEWHTHYRAPGTGMADVDVYIDGEKAATLLGTEINPTTEHKTDDATVYSVEGLTNGKHTIRFVSAKAGQMVVDYLAVYGTPEKKYTPGDVDGVEGVSADDAIYLLYHVYFGEQYPVNQSADMDGNGEVDADDAIYLLYHVYFGEQYPIGGKKDN